MERGKNKKQGQPAEEALDEKKPKRGFAVDDFAPDEEENPQETEQHKEPEKFKETDSDFEKAKREMSGPDEPEGKSKFDEASDPKLLLGINIAGLVVCAVFAFIFLVLVM